MQINGTTVIIEPGDTFHQSTGTVFYFYGESEDYPAIKFDSGSVCNRVISSLNGEDLSAIGGHRYIGIQPDFSFSSHEQQGISENEIYTGVLGLKNGKGWGMIAFDDQNDMDDQDYRADLRSSCFWQQNKNVDITCLTSSVIAESCTPSPTVEPTTVFSTPEVLMTETTTMVATSEPVTDVSSTGEVTSTPTSVPTATPTPTPPAGETTTAGVSTMTSGTSMTVTTPAETPTANPSRTETSSTTTGGDETSTSEIADETTTSSFPEVTVTDDR